jgi:DNA recombination protein RmuC
MASFEKAIALTKQGQEALNQAVKMLQKEVSDALSAITKTNSEMTAAVDKAGEMLSERFAGFSKDALNKLEGIKQEIMIQIMKNQGDRLDLFEEKLSKRLEESIIKLTSDVDGHLKEISGKVAERLDDGFKKTNETFTNVMARLATIDEAQKKIDGLTTNVVSLQELLGDKRSRGAFGEVQLENLVRNVLPASSYAMQVTLSNGSRADCALYLPDPTGTVCVDSKFPLENYHRMFTQGVSEQDRAAAQKQFRADVKKHVDDIAGKYIIANETSDGAVMFIPAEAVFAEIHAYNPEVVDYAMSRRVWIVSPTTMMAVLNTARAVIKDVETRKQVHIIKDALNKLGKEFERFDTRMKKLADHIRLAHEDALDVHTTSKKISERFRKIESVEVELDAAHAIDTLENLS